MLPESPKTAATRMEAAATSTAPATVSTVRAPSLRASNMTSAMNIGKKTRNATSAVPRLSTPNSFHVRHAPLCGLLLYAGVGGGENRDMRMLRI